jgi:hypothetical protein
MRNPPPPPPLREKPEITQSVQRIPTFKSIQLACLFTMFHYAETFVEERWNYLHERKAFIDYSASTSSLFQPMLL